MYKVKNDFIDSTLGKLKKNQKIEGDRADVLFRLGYLEKVKYKTKVVESEPKKRSNKKK